MKYVQEYQFQKKGKEILFVFSSCNNFKKKLKKKSWIEWFHGSKKKKKRASRGCLNH